MATFTPPLISRMMRSFSRVTLVIWIWSPTRAAAPSFSPASSQACLSQVPSALKSIGFLDLGM